MNLTNEEKKRVNAFKRATKNLPRTIKLYLTDAGSIVICKDKVSSDDYVDKVNCDIDAGCVLTDIHDDLF